MDFVASGHDADIRRHRCHPGWQRHKERCNADRRQDNPYTGGDDIYK